MEHKLKEVLDTSERLFEEADFMRGNTRGDPDYISEAQRRNIKSFLLSRQHAVIEAVVEWAKTQIKKQDHENYEELEGEELAKWMLTNAYNNFAEDLISYLREGEGK